MSVILPYCNSHCHLSTPVHDREWQLVSIDITTEKLPDMGIRPRTVYSIGQHPWHISETSQSDSIINSLAKRPDVKAIGECGLDKTIATPMALQQKVLEAQWCLAQELKIPMILHIVRSWGELLAFRKQKGDTIPLIVHGFRGNATLAAQLINHGFYLSFGPRYQSDAIKYAYLAEKMLLESDEHTEPIEFLYTEVAATLGTTEQILREKLFASNKLLFNL